MTPLQEHINKIALGKYPVVVWNFYEDYLSTERDIFLAGAALVLEMNLPVLFARYANENDEALDCNEDGEIMWDASFKYWIEKIYKP